MLKGYKDISTESHENLSKSERHIQAGKQERNNPEEISVW